MTLKFALLACLALPLGVRAQAPDEANRSTDIHSAPTRQPINPWTNLRFQNDPDQFQFVIVTDRTGGHRPGVFEDGVKKLSLLHPEFVMSVGDFIEGYTEDEAEIDRQWEEFESFLAPLKMPFFHVPGNHDISNPVMQRKWDERFGRSYYHFVYRDVLFLCLNSEDTRSNYLSDAQLDYFRKALADNPHVRWTLVFLHRPMWVSEEAAGAENQNVTNWLSFEELLKGRRYTVFAGHFHNYTKHERNDERYFVLATTGGATPLRGPAFGEFDHIVWVTMTDAGPQVANLWLEGIFDENIVDETWAQQIESLLSTGPVAVPAVLIEEPTFESTTVQLRLTNDSNYPMNVRGRFVEHRLRPTPHAIDRKISPNSVELVDLAVQAPQPTPVDQLTPMRVEWEIAFDVPDRPQARLAFVGTVAVQGLHDVPMRQTPVVVDGRLDEWPAFQYACEQPAQMLKNTRTWKGADDSSFRFATAHDDQNVYIAIDARDERVLSAPERFPWEQDGLEVRLDARPDPARSEGRGDREMRDFMLFAVSPGESVQTMGAFNADGWPQGTKVICLKTPTGYAAEIAVPVGYLNEKQGKPWERLRLNIAMDDQDEPGVEPSQIWWQPDWRTNENAPASGTFQKK